VQLLIAILKTTRRKFRKNLTRNDFKLVPPMPLAAGLLNPLSGTYLVTFKKAEIIGATKLVFTD
jgi:hypothetical protein